MTDILNLIEIAVEPIIEEAKKVAGEAVGFLKEVALELPMKAIQFVKETSLGTAIANLISAAESSGASGSDKLAAVIAASENAYSAFVANGGLSGLIATGVSILRALIEVLVANFKAAFEA